jgi:hypothetical protein
MRAWRGASCGSVDHSVKALLANEAYFLLLAVMRCKDIHKKIKVMFYKTLIHTVLTYGSETWTLSKKSENVLSIFRRKILR